MNNAFVPLVKATILDNGGLKRYNSFKSMEKFKNTNITILGQSF
jgi:hypothetical protein